MTNILKNKFVTYFLKYNFSIFLISYIRFIENINRR